MGGVAVPDADGDAALAYEYNYGFYLFLEVEAGLEGACAAIFFGATRVSRFRRVSRTDQVSPGALRTGPELAVGHCPVRS